MVSKDDTQQNITMEAEGKENRDYLRGESILNTK